MILDHFEEYKQKPKINGQCCDVCSRSEEFSIDCKEEVAAILQVVNDFPNKGSKKV